MDEFASRFADLLDERIIKPVRSITDDRVNKILVMTALGLVSGLLLLLGLLFVIVALFRVLGTFLTVEGAYAAVGGLFVIAGAFVWTKRFPKPRKNEDPPHG